MDHQTIQSTNQTLSTLLAIAWLLPLVGFSIEIFAGYWGGVNCRKSKVAAWMAVFCIAMGFVCSSSALCIWGKNTGWVALAAHDSHGDHGSQDEGDGGHADHGAAAHHDDAHGTKHADAGHEADKHDEHAKAEHEEHAKAAHDDHAEHGDEHAAEHASDKLPAQTVYSGSFYQLARFGDLSISIDYYIDSLTLVMFTMVTFIATCIHLFAMGYMSEELTEEYVDHQVHTSHGHLHRPGRFYRFFAFLSLFCFSMLGLVLAGNIFLVFIFWELVGVCSYFLIGFYTERKSASTAANKAFIMNRVGDFGFLIGLMILWTSFGTFQFGPLFTNVRGTDGQILVTQNGPECLPEIVFKDGSNNKLMTPDGREKSIPYYLLVVAGLGIFAGCIGKSAQFPLQTWLPDAMEGPTPVSALVHSATMVAAGVYLAARFHPMFTPEVLLTIAYVGCITAFLAATIAIVATDIKKVLAYSTISQLGYMMLALGVAGWGAGLFHLITHAFFKSLLFLCSGSVIYGCHHEQEMPKMGGLRKKMPITAYTMLIAVIAISGLAIPGFKPYLGYELAFSGYHSKDAIVATALTYTKMNGHQLLFIIPLVTAGITAFYMFRLWFYTFTGEPRDHHVHEHAHESPWIMTAPLIALSVLAAFCALKGEDGFLFRMLTHSEPVGLAATAEHVGLSKLTLPGHAAVHANHFVAGWMALVAAVSGTFLAYLFYCKKVVDPAAISKQFPRTQAFLVNKWGFDDLYDVVFVKGARTVATWASAVDKYVFDGFLHAASRVTVNVSNLDRRFDEAVIDGLVNLVGNVTYRTGRMLKVVQTGSMRNYVAFIAVGLLGIFVLLLALFPAGS